MLKRTFSVLMLTLLLASMLTLAFKIHPVKAAGTIYIRADGSIDPPDALISTIDNVTYTLTGDITSDTDGIVVERSNIAVDGAGYTLQGTGAHESKGISHSATSNVTIKNTEIITFYYGIRLDSSSNNSISGNNITNNVCGVYLYSSSNSSISGNNITAYNNNWVGIELDTSSNYNSISGNNITNNFYGIVDYSSNFNSISGNTFINDGLSVQSSYENSVENNTVNGRPLVYLEGVSNYTVDDAGQVILVRCENIRVEGLNLSSTDVDVILWETNSSTISGNNITTDDRFGIELDFSNYNSIVGNNITNNYYGIWLNSHSDHYSNYNSIVGNNITNNYYGIWLNYDSNNSISGNNITNNFYGIWLYSSSNNSISGNNITNNVYGSRLRSSSNNSISGNNITANNAYGILLESSSNSSISGNNITANDGSGIRLWYTSSYNSIVGNNITNNRYGVYLDYSSDNIFYHNNFVANTQQVNSTSSANVWDYGYPSGGNYWSDYNGADLYSGLYQNETGSDGVGDTQYVIDENNTDHYPLMNPHTPQHDVAVMNVSPFKTVVGQGYNLNVSVTAANPGDYTEAFNVTAYYWNGTFTPEQWNEFWHMGDCNRDGYINNADKEIIDANYGWTGPPNTNPADIAPPYGVVGLSDLVTYALHEGNNTWKYFLPAVDTETIVDLVGGNSATLTCEWNTTGVAYGNYTVDAVADPVVNETNTADNNCTCGIFVHVGVPGDVSSTTPGVYDGVDNMKDIAYMVSLFNTKPISSNWNPNADVNNDGICNMRDIAIAIQNFNQHE